MRQRVGIYMSKTLPDPWFKSVFFSVVPDLSLWLKSRYCKKEFYMSAPRLKIVNIGCQDVSRDSNPVHFQL
jgi:hypothetical protein